jgi:hypothetical protein
LSSKTLCKTHRNKSAWGESVEQADLPRINKDALRSLSYRKDTYSRSAQNGVKAFLKSFHNCNLCPSDSLSSPSTAKVLNQCT